MIEQVEGTQSRQIFGNNLILPIAEKDRLQVFDIWQVVNTGIPSEIPLECDEGCLNCPIWEKNKCLGPVASNAILSNLSGNRSPEDSDQEYQRQIKVLREILDLCPYLNQNDIPVHALLETA